MNAISIYMMVKLKLFVEEGDEDDQAGLGQIDNQAGDHIDVGMFEKDTQDGVHIDTSTVET